MLLDTEVNITNKIARFWQKYGYYDVPYDKLLWVIGEHLKYRTLEVVEVGKEVVAIARYNIVGETVVVLDVVIKPSHRFKRLLKLMLLKGLKKWKVKFMEFERGLKDKRKRRFMVSKFIGVKK